MSRPSVYLAGPITGLSFGAAQDWREYAIQYFTDLGIDAFSPLRGKYYLNGEKELKDSYAQTVSPLSTPHAIVTRDRFDTTSRDLLLVNFLGATKVSIGTVMEIAWADMLRKPIILVMEAGNVHTHSMLTEVSGYIVTDLDEALDVAAKVLLPGRHVDKAERVVAIDSTPIVDAPTGEESKQIVTYLIETNKELSASIAGQITYLRKMDRSPLSILLSFAAFEAMLNALGYDLARRERIKAFVAIAEASIAYIAGCPVYVSRKLTKTPVQVVGEVDWK